MMMMDVLCWLDRAPSLMMVMVMAMMEIMLGYSAAQLQEYSFAAPLTRCTAERQRG
jgi:hypothetical protein